MPMSPPPPDPAHDGTAVAVGLRPAWVLAALALWLLATLGLRPLLLPDEGRYAGVALEMLRGDGLVPTLHGLPFFHKPPLMYWLDMAAMAVFGVDPFAARCAPAVGAWLMGAALYLDLRRRRGAHEAAVALAVLATMPFFFVGGQYANHDMLVAGCITVVVLCVRRAVDDPRHTALRWLIGAWVAAAFALLAKGLIGVVLPALVLAPWLLAQRRWRDLLRLLHPAGLAVFALIAAPWFVLMQMRYPGFVDYFFVEQHFRRFAQAGFNNAQPFWFYLPVLLSLTLPWSLWLPGLARAWWARPRGAPRGAAGTGDAALYAWWIVAVLGFFSLPQSKVVGYVLPALAPLAALLGAAASRGSAWRRVLPLAAAACLAVVAALAWKAPGSHRDVAQALAARAGADDRVVFVQEVFFDVPFYARLTRPPILLADWDDPQIGERDDWHKELRDAARFDPDAAAARLWPTDRAAALLCRPDTVWFIAAADWRPSPGLAGLEPVVGARHARLWRGEGGPRPGCP